MKIGFGKLLDGERFELLKGLQVGVVGCSGTGSIIIELLTRNAVGTLVIIDDDSLDPLNLNRIINSTSADAHLKRPKVKAIEEAIGRIGLGNDGPRVRGTNRFGIRRKGLD